MARQRLEVEFGQYLSWVVDAIVGASLEDAVPAACRDLGGPALLEEVARVGGLREGVALLDIGCGIGGPAAWLARRGIDVVGTDVSEAAVGGAKTLFPELVVARASWRFLPFPEGRFDAITALGVLELVQDKPMCLEETKRALRSGGRAIVYDYFRTEEDPIDAPAANRFVTHAEMLALVSDKGFSVRWDEPIDPGAMGSGPWKEVAMAIEAEITATHGGDASLQAARAEKALFRRLRDEGAISPRLMVLEP